MKLTVVPRFFYAGAMLGMLSTLGVSAGTISHARPPVRTSKPINVGTHGGVRFNLTCPPTYTQCVSPVKSSPFTAFWCTGSCGEGFGYWIWSAVVTQLGRGDGYKHVIARWSPNPGTASTLTISDRRSKAKGTKIIASVAASTCNPAGTCYSDFAVYGVTN